MTSNEAGLKRKNGTLKKIEKFARYEQRKAKNIEMRDNKRVKGTEMKSGRWKDKDETRG